MPGDHFEGGTPGTFPWNRRNQNRGTGWVATGKVVLCGETTHRVTDHNWGSVEHIHNLCYVGHVVGYRSPPDLAFALTMATETQGKTVVSLVGKGRHDELVPSPRCLPESMHKKQRGAAIGWPAPLDYLEIQTSISPYLR